MPITDGQGPLRVGVVKLASCDGCQLAFLDLGPALLDIGVRFQIVEFGEASSDRAPEGPFDILFVEGSISTADQLRHIRHLRDRTATLVTIGACATSGGIQALRGWATRDGGMAGFIEAVYAKPEYIDTLATATPVADHVTVDAELRGCPIDTGQLLELLTATATGRRPQLPNEAVCVACKRAGRVCVMVARGEPCLGPIIATGCGALCPGMARGCYGCFGPRESANGASLAQWFRDPLGLSDERVAARFAGFTGWAPELRAVIDSAGGPPGMRAAVELAPAAASPAAASPASASPAADSPAAASASPSEAGETKRGSP
jgi:coenzyme F420-reducing hydrogenase gamma subunit